jgi:glycosyltransferase involved in cell wall biosynthesis
MYENTSPIVSVLLPVYNGEAYLRQAVDSILSQSLDNFELLLLNNSSTDGTNAICTDYSRRDSRIRYFQRDSKSLISSLNDGIKLCRGEFIARMDADDISMPERFDLQVRYLRENSDLSVVGSAIAVIDETGAVISNHVPYNPLIPAKSNLPMNETLIVHPATMIRRSTLIEIGGYRAGFLHCEDRDLWLRLLHKGALANLKEVLLHYRRHPGQVTSSKILEMVSNGAIAHLNYQQLCATDNDPLKRADKLPTITELNSVFHSPLAKLRYLEEMSKRTLNLDQTATKGISLTYANQFLVEAIICKALVKQASQNWITAIAKIIRAKLKL